jgi:hypothetical protein
VTSFSGFLRVARLAILVPLAAASYAQTAVAPRAPSDADVRELTRRFAALSKQLDNLEAAKNDAVRETIMKQHWLAMQDDMGWMHGRFRTGAPWMMDPDSRGGPGVSACPMLGGSGAAWPPPEGVSPKLYAEQMRAHMRTLNEQVSRIAQATDPEERMRLAQELWQAMYRDMQGMRGLGWMWGAGLMGNAPEPGTGMTEPLPDPGSTGAKLVSIYCTQCHAPPTPALLTSKQWERVLNRMHLRIEGRVTPIETPSEQELEAILAYMKQHARE